MYCLSLPVPFYVLFSLSVAFFVEKYPRSINGNFSVLKFNEYLQLLATNTYESRSNNLK
jgi:hypothetical protein